jgi:thioredoxin-related protein
MTTKLLTLIAFLLVNIAGISAQEQPSATAVLEKAYTQAKKENKKVFVIFHASWCSWCKKMDSHMTSPELKDMFEKNYVITHLTVQESPKNKNLENPGAEDLLKKFKAEKSGIPFFVVLDAKGNLLEDSFDSNGQNLGCPASTEEVAEFKRILKSTSKLTEKELGMIADKFTIKK